MQKIEQKIKNAMLIFIAIIILGVDLIEYAFNITLFRQLIILPLAFILILIFGYFYFRPNFIVKRRKEILLLAVVLFIFFIILEVTLRLTHCGWNWTVTPDEQIKYRYEPSEKVCNSIIDGKKFYRTANNKGFIDEDFVYNESDYTIFLVGDSMAACLESDYENCVHQKLEKDLKELYGDNINVMNFGVSSYSGLAELAVVEKYVPEYKPKMIILYFFINDFQENEDYENQIYLITKSEKIVRTLTPKTFLFFFNGGKNLLDNVLIKSSWYRDVSGLEIKAVQGKQIYAYNYTEDKQELIEKELKVLDEIYRIASENNITLIHVATTAPEQVYDEKWMEAFETYPSLNISEYNSSKPNSIIMNYASQKGVHNLDLLPLFRENPDYLHWDEGHWNDKGQLYAEEKILEYIQQNNLIKYNQI